MTDESFVVGRVGPTLLHVETTVSADHRRMNQLWLTSLAPSVVFVESLTLELFYTRGLGKMALHDLTPEPLKTLPPGEATLLLDESSAKGRTEGRAVSGGFLVIRVRLHTVDDVLDETLYAECDVAADSVRLAPYWDNVASRQFIEVANERYARQAS